MRCIGSRTQVAAAAASIKLDIGLAVVTLKLELLICFRLLFRGEACLATVCKRLPTSVLLIMQ